MPFVIEDSLNGNKMRVNKNNRATTQAITEFRVDLAAEIGEKYNINTA